MESNWKILQLLIELVAHVSLDIGTRGKHQPAPKENEQCLENTKKQNQTDRRQERVKAPRDQGIH